MTNDPPRDLKEFDYLYKQLDDLYHAISLKIGLSDSTCVVLCAMAEMGDGCLQKDISDRYSIRRQTINSAIKNLEKAGYLRLTKGKGRDMHLSFTETGKIFCQKHIMPILELENSTFSAMTLQERTELLRLTRKYVSIFAKKPISFLEQELEKDE